MTREDLIVLYRLLAHSLGYPDRDFVRRVQEAVGQIRMQLWDDPRLPLSTLIEELGQLAQLPLEQLQGEHTRLFIAAYPRVPCPPYESVYLEGTLQGEAAEDVDRMYREWGLAVQKEEADHAGAELEFVAFLLTIETRESLAAAARFLSEHLLAWLPRFAVDLARESNLGFHRALGNLLSATLDLESQPGGSWWAGAEPSRQLPPGLYP